MANDLIKKHNFELAKNRILTASQNVPSSVSLSRFPTEGSIFPWNDHNITGNEANSLLVTPLQQTLISQNTGIKDLFKIAKDVYNALDTLDKEYIAGIVGAVEAAKIASNQAKTASDHAKQASEQALDASIEALDASEKAKNAQADIKRTIEALQKTVNILKEFKGDVSVKLTSLSSIPSQINSLKTKVKSVEDEYNRVLRAANNLQAIGYELKNLRHLKDVDNIWNDLDTSKKSLSGLFDIISPFMQKVNEADKNIKKELKSINDYLLAIEHFQDIDTIWSDVEGHKTNLAGLHQQVDAFIEKVNQTTERINSDIAALQEYRSVLESYQHLGEIDTIWSDVEDHKININGLHEQIDGFIEDTHQKERELNVKIEELSTIQEATSKQFNKKLKVAYGIAGGAVALSLIQLALQLFGIL